MAYGTTNADMGEYRRVEAGGSLSDASPHRVVQVMYQTVLDRVAMAKGHMQRREIASKAAAIRKALVIIEALQLNLDRDRGGDVAENLNSLYEYMMELLVKANADDRPELLDEVSQLMIEIKSGWDAIAPAA